VTASTFATTGASPIFEPPPEYRAGVCNIGPAEIARRRRAGHVGLIAALGLLAVLVAVDAPSWTRLLVAIPVIGAASGYIQARLRFCAAFGSRGIFNFGDTGRSEQVGDAADRARDRARSMQIGLASAVIGVVAGVVAFALPL